ncbi:MAG: tRNA (adenosine(37)-N6)-threonylcarbamoyltransferase complex dimerization subunit type 1 TsaB [Betaproteobacteria bacterium]
MGTSRVTSHMPAYKLLALETSTERLSLAIRLGDEVFVREVDAGQRHSELTLPLMYELLADAGTDLADLDVVAFGQGPGSFTGVRIACGLTQGLAFGGGKGVVPVPTQMALAEQSGAQKVVVALDARMGEIYVAAYCRSEDATGWTAEVAPMLVKPDALPAIAGDCWHGIGSGFDVPALAASLAARYGAQIAHVTLNALPSAREVAAIAARQLAKLGLDSALSPEHAAPLYLRNKVAMTIAERAAHHLKKAAA